LLINNPITRHENKLRAGFWCWLLIAGLFKVFLIAGQPITALGIAASDDRLFLELANNLLSGNWLGIYNNHTLVKMPFYSFFIAGSFLSGIPLKICEHLLYIGCGVLVITTLSKIVKCQITLFAIFVFFVYNPMSYSGPMSNVLRGCIYPALTVIPLLALFELTLANITRFITGLKWAMLFGLSLGLFWITREEGEWLLPSIFMVVMLSYWWKLRINNGSKQNKYYTMHLGLAIIVFFCVLSVLLLGNKLKYGVAIINDVKHDSYQKAYGALQRVKSNTEHRMIPVPQAARENIYSVSPAFVELKSYLEGELKERWSRSMCQIVPSTCGDIAGAHFSWALRDAVALAGYYSSVEDAIHYYNLLADQVNNACNDGLLRCHAHHASTRPILGITDYPAWFLNTFKAIYFLVTFSNFNPKPISSVGTQEQLDFFREMTHSTITPTATNRSRLIIHGWAVSLDQSVEVAVVGNNTVQTSFEVKRSGSPGVALTYPNWLNPESARFRIVTTCLTDCDITFYNGEKILYNIPINNLEVGLLKIKKSLHIFIDEIKIQNYSDSIKGKYNNLKTSIMFKIGGFYQIIVPLLFLFALFGYVSLLVNIIRLGPSPLFIFCTALIVAIIVRAALIGLIDLTAWPALQQIRMYSPVYPMVLLFCSLGTLAAVQQIIDRYSDTGWRLINY
jgi:hypothetical protein